MIVHGADSIKGCAVWYFPALCRWLFWSVHARANLARPVEHPLLRMPCGEILCKWLFVTHVAGLNVGLTLCVLLSGTVISFGQLNTIRPGWLVRACRERTATGAHNAISPDPLQVAVRAGVIG